MKGRGSCGGNERANRVGYSWMGGGDGCWEVEERPVRMRAFQAIVHGKVVQKMHMIVSRCPFTLLMSLAVRFTRIPESFLCLCAHLSVHWRGGDTSRKRHLYSPERRTVYSEKASLL